MGKTGDQMKMLNQLRKAQKELKNEIVEVEAGDGAVVIQINGELKIKDVSIDPEDIAEAVDAWLDDHPEATTTVEDGSITKAKLHDDVAERIDEVDELYEIIDPQEKVVPSKNLNVTPYVSATKSGCTFTVNEDNTVSLSGDPEATVYYPNVSENKDKRWKLPKGQYTLSGGIDAWKGVTLFLYVDQTDSSAAKEYVCGGYDGRPVTFTTEPPLAGTVSALKYLRSSVSILEAIYLANASSWLVG